MALLSGTDQVSPVPAMSAGRTLPASAYTAEAFFKLEIEKVFEQDWLCIGHVSQVSNVGDYFTTRLLGEPLIVVRGQDRIRVLSGVCLHRWAPVASGTGNVKLFSCPFHKWGYALDGRLLGAPFMEQAAEFATCTERLPEIRSEIVPALGLIFITFSDRVGSIDERLEDLSAHVANWHVSDLVVARRRERSADFNWKIQIETYMECYHHIGAHPTTFEVDAPARLSWCEESRKGWTVCHSPIRPELPDEAQTVGLPMMPDLTPAERRTCEYILIFPATLMNVRPDVVSFSMLAPVSPKRTDTVSMTLVRPEVAADKEQVEAAFAARRDFWDKTNQEDTDVNLAQQKGGFSRMAEPGPLSHLEATVGHLAEYVRGRLAAN